MPGEPLGTDRLRNIATGAVIDRNNAQNSLECIDFGDHQYNNCVDSRQDKKVASIQDFASCNKCYLKPNVVQHKKPGKQPAQSDLQEHNLVAAFGMDRGL